MKKITLYSFLLTISLFVLIFVPSCKKPPYEIDSENTINLEMTSATESELVTETQKWQITKKHICVILGYDFNEKEMVEEITSLLASRYGLAEDGGLIVLYTYPEDFKAGGRSYHNNLRLILQNDIENLSGVIILGAPERTHIALARNQDYWNMNVPYPVIALFPQDDVLGLESTCDIVLDKGQAINYNGEILESGHDSVVITEAPDILIDTIDYIAEYDGAFPKNKSLSNHVFNMYEGYKIHHYVDGETGLQSVNHFILN